MVSSRVAKTLDTPDSGERRSQPWLDDGLSSHSCTSATAAGVDAQVLGPVPVMLRDPLGAASKSPPGEDQFEPGENVWIHVALPG